MVIVIARSIELDGWLVSTVPICQPRCLRLTLIIRQLAQLVYARPERRCIHCKKRGVTEHPRGAIFYCFRGNSIGYHGNSKILLPWGVLIHRVFYSVLLASNLVILQWTTAAGSSCGQ